MPTRSGATLHTSPRRDAIPPRPHHRGHERGHRPLDADGRGQLPPELDIPQGHGKVPWLVRAIWEEHAGWFRYESTTELYDVPPAAMWPELFELAGGPGPLLSRARAHLDSGRPLHALQFVDIVLAQEPDDAAALDVKLGRARAAARRPAAARTSARSGGSSRRSATPPRSGTHETRRPLPLRHRRRRRRRHQGWLTETAGYRWGDHGRRGPAHRDRRPASARVPMRIAYSVDEPRLELVAEHPRHHLGAHRLGRPPPRLLVRRRRR